MKDIKETKWIAVVGLRPASNEPKTSASGFPKFYEKGHLHVV